MNEKNTVIIDAENGTESSGIQISRFTDNFDSIKFYIDGNMYGHTFMIITESNNSPAIFECDGNQLSAVFDSAENKTILTWRLPVEVTCSDGIVIYQIVAYKTENDEIVSTWYSREGRIIVCDSIDTNRFSNELIGAYPNLITRLILKTDTLKSLIQSVSDSKVDKAEGKALSSNDFTDEFVSKLESVEENAQINRIESVKVDGVTLEPDISDKSVNIDIRSQIEQSEEHCNSMIDSLHNAMIYEISQKVNAENGKGLSSNDFTDDEKAKLEGIEAGAGKNVRADWNEADSSAQSYIQNKPAVINTVNIDFPDADDDDYSFANELTGNGYGTTLYYGTRCGYDPYFIITTNISEDALRYSQCGILSSGIGITSKYGNSRWLHRNGELYYDPEFGISFINWEPWSPFLTAENFADVLYVKPFTSINYTVEPNTAYNLGTQTELILRFPSADVKDGDTIYITFESGESPTNLTFETSNISDIYLVPEANTGYEIFAKYNGKLWIVNYSEYTVNGATS